MEDIAIPTQWENLCICCLSDDCSKDISAEFYVSGQKEVYKDMLKETLDVQVSYWENTHQLICENCISKLRDAFQFKQMIIQSAEVIKKYLQSIENDTKPNAEEPIQSVIKLEFSNDECSNNSEQFTHDVSMKEDAVKEENVDKRQPKKRRVNEKMKEDNLISECIKKPVKLKSDIRGNAPILRENSLKLIENSTICVFQWNRSRYRCFCCKEPFSDVNLLRDHTNKHSIKEICKIIISQQNRLVKVEISLLFCKICGHECTNLDSLKQHLENHSINFTNKDDLLVPYKINNNLQCQICNEHFTKFRLLNIHVNKHFLRQVCHVCGAGFTNLVFLNLHKSRNHRIWNCESCNLTFDSKVDKKKHDVAIHNVKFVKRLRYPCQYCSERFYKESDRVKHLVDIHNMEKPQHMCNFCSKVYITKSLLNNHIKIIHLKEKNKECDECHNFFYTNSDVLRHKLTHSGEKKFSCTVCNTFFATKNSVRRHMKRTHLSLL